VDLLSEITIAPSYRPEASALLPATLRAEVDTYMAARQPATFLTSLKQRLLLPQHETVLCGTKYSQPLLNALVFYVGIRVRQSHLPRCIYLMVSISTKGMAWLLTALSCRKGNTCDASLWE